MKKQEHIRRTEWRVEDILLHLHGLTEEIPITVGQVCEGVMVMGASGSGKTTGPVHDIQLAEMKADFGMLNLSVKLDEAARARRLANKAGRGKDVMVMKMGGPTKMNFLDILREGGPDDVVSAFKQISQALMGQIEENEWTQMSQQHLSNLVKLFILSGKRLEVSELRLAAIDLKTQKMLLDEAATRISMDTPDAHTLKMVSSYFSKEWRMMKDETKASVLMSLTPTLNPFCDGPMRELFCTDTTFHPKMLREGKILIMDIPCVGEQCVYGIAANVIMKYIVQRMIVSDYKEGRITNERTIRPVVIIADECHYLVTVTDSEFITTSRSMRCSMFYATQQINNFYRRSGRTVEAETNILLSEMHGVRVMCQNGDEKTYKWFMSLLGEEWRERTSLSANFSGPTGAGSAGASMQMHKENQLSQRDLSIGLARGGPAYDFVVTGILQQSGHTYAGGKMFSQVAFPQQFDFLRKKGVSSGLFHRLFGKRGKQKNN